MSEAKFERVFVPLGTFVTFGYKSKEETLDSRLRYSGMTGTLDCFVPRNDEYIGNQGTPRNDKIRKRKLYELHALHQSYIHPCRSPRSPMKRDRKTEKNPLYHGFVRGYFSFANFCKRYNGSHLE